MHSYINLIGTKTLNKYEQWNRNAQFQPNSLQL